MNIQIEGLQELSRAFLRAELTLSRELETSTRVIGERVAAVLPRNEGASGNEIPVTHLGPHQIELWGPDVRPGQEPRPFILASRVGELPDVEEHYGEGVERAIRQVSS